MSALQNCPIPANTQNLQSGLRPKPIFASPRPLLSLGGQSPSISLSLRARRGVQTFATVAGCYAEALADVAKSNNTLDATSGDIDKIEKIFTNEEVSTFFCNPVMDPEKKREVLDQIVESSGFQAHVANFLNILLDAKRIDMIEEIVKEFEVVYNSITDTQLAVVSSVVQLESQHLSQIAKQIQKLTGSKNIRIKTVIDPSLVAGFTIRYGLDGSKLIDMSVKKQLEEIAAQLEIKDIKLGA